MAPNGAISSLWIMMSTALVLLDESGDLGWNFNSPYRQGGSSRFFTIASIIGHNNQHREFGKFVRSFIGDHNWTSKHEKKWTDLSDSIRRDFAKKLVLLKQKNPELTLLVSVIEKEKLPKHIQGNHHLIYSWMAASLLSPSVRVYRQISICPDELNYGSNNSGLIDNFLRKELWFNLRSSTVVNHVARSHALENALIFADYLAGAVQSHFEDSRSEPFNIIQSSIFVHRPWI